MRIILGAMLFVLSIGLSNRQAIAANDCMTACHRKVLEQKNLHQPVREEDCFACHVKKAAAHPEKGSKSFGLNAAGATFCEQCHSPLLLGKVVHEPVRQGACTGCHNPHGAESRKLLDIGTDQTGFCTRCHDTKLFGQRYMHGPVAVGACAECHAPHAAPQRGLLRVPEREMCLGCHEDLEGAIEEAQVVHAPVEKDPCTSCHEPHGATNGMFLKKKMPELCVGCHASIGKKLASLKVPHKPVQEGNGCGSCHSPHYGSSKGLFATDARDLCLTCHGTDKLGQPPLRNIRKDIDKKKQLHGPVRNGDCKACHDPHGSDNFRMLKGAYPRDLYVPYREGRYDACFACHEKNMLRFADTTIYTKFRNGNRNLHYLHVSNSRKGRTCRVCHEAHASDGEKLISKEGMQFGEWKIPVGFTITPTGGSCAPGCHRAFRYDREKPETYQQDPKPETPSERTSTR